MNKKIPYPAPPVYPPAGHPRVLFTQKDIPNIADRILRPQNANALRIHKQNLKCTSDGSLPPGGGNNFDDFLLGVIESFAFEYAVTGEAAYGRCAASMMKNFLRTADMGIDDYSYNVIGQLIFTIAEVYDWCYPFLTAEDRQYYYDKTIKFAAMLEVGWPPVEQGAVTGHGPEGQVVRDLLSAGIAMYDEFPDIYEWVAGRLFAEFVAPREFMYRAHMLNQGSHYVSYRTQWDIISTRIIDVLGIPQVYGPNQQYVLYWALYARRPDGLVLPDGDDNFSRRPRDIYARSYARTFFHIGNYFGDPYLKWEAMRELPHMTPERPFANQALGSVEFLICNDPDLGGRHISGLPLSKYFPSPKGGMIARTGWSDGKDSPAVVCEMKINEWWFANHHHLDAGSFQIYYKGMLATDTGYYQASMEIPADLDSNNGSTHYASMHDYNYYKRTIAHNTMLVHDPHEVFQSNHGKRLSNDGGQKLVNNGEENRLLEDMLGGEEHHICDILGHEIGESHEPDYTYLKGDLTRAYSNKVEAFERSFMFLNLKEEAHPAALIVFDRVVSSDTAFKKTWLLHGLHEPDISENKAVFSDTRPGYNGKLTLHTLLPSPENTAYEVVGGEGSEFMVDGVNYHAKLTPGRVHESGGYRLELSPKAPSKCDYFLNVMQVSDADSTSPELDTLQIDTATHYGVMIADRMVLFGKNRDRYKENLTFNIPANGAYQITVCDIHHGLWDISRDGKSICRAVATQEGGMLVFTGGEGLYTLEFMAENIARPAKSAEAAQQGGNIGLRVDDRFVYTPVAPRMIDGELMIPASAVAKALDIEAKWDAFANIMYLNTTPDDGDALICDEALENQSHKAK